MTLLTKTPKNVVGLDGFGIKILNQEIISWKKKSY
jgi:3,4-dihydroxy 2-butanone 4-phosphate synthase/GTP cyclohydrolase II